MRGGQLDQRVGLYRLIKSRDVAGGPVSTPQHVADVSADVRGQRGDKSFEAAQSAASRTVKILLRWRDDVETDWVVRWNGDDFDIVDVDRSLRRDGELWLMAVLRKSA